MKDPVFQPSIASESSIASSGSMKHGRAIAGAQASALRLPNGPWKSTADTSRSRTGRRTDPCFEYRCRRRSNRQRHTLRDRPVRQWGDTHETHTHDRRSSWKSAEVVGGEIVAVQVSEEV